MRVILIQNIKALGRAGDIKDVSDGYARNFLIARKLARLADASAEKQSELLKQKNARQLAKTTEEMTELAKALSEIILKIEEDANEEGHLYGSVDAKTIIKELEKQKKIKIQESAVNLKKHIKSLGEYEVEINLNPEIAAKLKVIVEKK